MTDEGIYHSRGHYKRELLNYKSKAINTGPFPDESRKTKKGLEWHMINLGVQ